MVISSFPLSVQYKRPTPIKSSAPQQKTLRHVLHPENPARKRRKSVAPLRDARRVSGVAAKRGSTSNSSRAASMGRSWGQTRAHPAGGRCRLDRADAPEKSAERPRRLRRRQTVRPNLAQSDASWCCFPTGPGAARSAPSPPDRAGSFRLKDANCAPAPQGLACHLLDRGIAGGRKIPPATPPFWGTCPCSGRCRQNAVGPRGGDPG